MTFYLPEFNYRSLLDLYDRVDDKFFEWKDIEPTKGKIALYEISSIGSIRYKKSKQHIKLYGKDSYYLNNTKVSLEDLMKKYFNVYCPYGSSAQIVNVPEDAYLEMLIVSYDRENRCQICLRGNSTDEDICVRCEYHLQDKKEENDDPFVD